MAALYLIEILHQTTTSSRARARLLCCILLKFYIKPQRENYLNTDESRCILSKFYIKPQLRRLISKIWFVVSYRNSTSNHNYRGFIPILLYVVSYRNSTSNHNCSLFSLSRLCVVSYRNSTSNHNFAKAYFLRIKLYLIEILHQTTTRYPRLFKLSSCILSKFYIKPQRFMPTVLLRTSCILSKFYIKPQLSMAPSKSTVSCILSKFYIKPQQFPILKILLVVVSYRNSTSNHNRGLGRSKTGAVVSYRNSTSNHNRPFPTNVKATLYLIEILHQTTT